MKTVLKIVICLAVFGAIGFAAFSLGKQPANALAGVYTCNPDGTYAAPSSGPALLTSADLANVSASAAWLESMTLTNTVTVTDSTITPDTDYALNYQGAVSGDFSLDTRTYPSDAAITISSPTPVSDAYRGVVTGQVVPAPEQWRWIIQAYKRVNGVVSQVPVQALADGTTGEFSIDLSGVSAGTPGEWMFGILDANNSYAPYGEKWPGANYVGLEVQQYVVTDSIYYWSTTPAHTDGTFTFPNSNTGEKLYRLVDTSTNPDEILAEYIKPTGLLRSYLYQPGETGYGTAMESRSFVYDQALALEAAVSLGDNALAKLMVDGLLRLQTASGTHSGGFVFAAPQLSPSYTDPLYRTGAHAIATDALLSYIQKYPSDPNVAIYRAAAVNALSFLQSTLSTSGGSAGLYLGGYGQYSGSPQVFDPNFTIEWASTEHNLDSWHTLTRASNVLGNGSVNYKQQAVQLESAIQSVLYNTAEHRFNQGFNNGGPDLADPLDTNSWGAIGLYATGHIQEAYDALARVSLFSHTSGNVSGYAPFYDAGGYPGATPTVWYEGSFGVALAHYKLGDYQAYRNLLDSLSNGQESDGSFRYATTPDTTYEIGESKSVASTAWYILATAGRDTIWNSCIYTPPTIPEAPTVPTTPIVTTPQPVKNTPSKTAIKYTDNANTITPEVITETPSEVTTPLKPIADRDDTTNPADDNDKESDKGSSPTPIIIGSIAGVLLLASIAAVIAAFVRRNR
jgi:hypothetical protein